MPPTWALVVDGVPAPWPLGAAASLDSLEAVAARALQAVQREGYYFARLDSAAIDRSGLRPAVRLYVDRGPAVEVETVELRGVRSLDALELARQMDTRAGRPLDPAALDADLDAILRRYEEAGLPLAQVYLDEVTLTEGEAPTLRLVLRVEEGRTLRLSGIDVDGGDRTRPAYLARVAGLRLGAPLAAYDLADVQRRLEATGFFERVDRPELRLVSDTVAVLYVQVEEEPPGAFDLVLGLQPSPGASRRLQLVGNGHLVLRNLFGGGREVSFQLNRLPGQVSRLEAGIADPYVLGSPLGLAAGFEGLQQDSTFGQQRYRLETSYRLGRGLDVVATLSRELTRPGQAGVRLGASGQQRIPRSAAWFAGLGIRYQSLDRLVNPRRGLLVETSLEQGRKERTARARVEGDTTFVRSTLRQERLRAHARLFVPTFARQLVVVGGDAAVLLSSEYDRSDLFRFGGATTLRGYDEDRFLGRFVGRTLAEYRLQLDRLSYTYAFVDVGYVERPEVVGEEGEAGALTASRDVYPGYGVGIQFSTEVGLINASYAVSPDDGPTAGRVHVGLSFGL